MTRDFKTSRGAIPSNRSVGGEFLVGFGTAYEGGCTSGHGLSGIGDLQLPSVIALIGFFSGGTAGTVFGIVITKAEVISFFRIQEMFRFQGFHMFGIFATAVPGAIVTVQTLSG